MRLDERAYRACLLCPRRCGVDRVAGETGVCGETSALRIASAGPHFGEEPSFSGTRGSGTVFFAGCASRCLFCQNHQISMRYDGPPVTQAGFVERLRGLMDQGVHNLNLVTPDHFWPHIRAALEEIADERSIPVVFNISGYQEVHRVEAYGQAGEIFLTDYKFADPALAAQIMGDARYPEIALAALQAMVGQRGFLHPWDPSGEHTAVEGVLVRHLVIPGAVGNSIDALTRLRHEFGRLLPLSVMSQYQPVPDVRDRPPLNRHLTRAEYDAVCAAVADLGFEHVYLQALSEETEYLPDFQHDQPFQGNRR
jgi:putative pyruvate formate lyase activating enzyme